MKIRMSFNTNDKEGEQTVEPVIWSQLCTGLPDLQPKSPTKKCMSTLHVLGLLYMHWDRWPLCFLHFQKHKETWHVQKEVIWSSIREVRFLSSFPENFLMGFFVCLFGDLGGGFFSIYRILNVYSLGNLFLCACKRNAHKLMCIGMHTWLI